MKYVFYSLMLVLGAVNFANAAPASEAEEPIGEAPSQNDHFDSLTASELFSNELLFEAYGEVFADVPSDVFEVPTAEDPEILNETVLADEVSDGQGTEQTIDDSILADDPSQEPSPESAADHDLVGDTSGSALQTLADESGLSPEAVAQLLVAVATMLQQPGGGDGIVRTLVGAYNSVLNTPGTLSDPSDERATTAMNNLINWSNSGELMEGTRDSAFLVLMRLYSRREGMRAAIRAHAVVSNRREVFVATLRRVHNAQNAETEAGRAVRAQIVTFAEATSISVTP